MPNSWDPRAVFPDLVGFSKVSRQGGKANYARLDVGDSTTVFGSTTDTASGVVITIGFTMAAAIEVLLINYMDTKKVINLHVCEYRLGI